MRRFSAIERLARALAILGGLTLIIVISLTVVSITGRTFVRYGLGPTPGDFELVETMTAFAIFSFLPWCQLRGAHATVDIFTSAFPAKVNRAIDLVSEILMSLVISLIAWRLWHGMADKLRYNETTFILQFPIWWGFAAAMAAMAVAVIASYYMVFLRLQDVITGRTQTGAAEGWHL